MLLFCKDEIRKGKIIVSTDRVFEIIAVNCNIIINYDSGELMEVGGTMAKKIETIRITFDDPDEVEKNFRQFYKAANAGATAFYFG